MSPPIHIPGAYGSREPPSQPSFLASLIAVPFSSINKNDNTEEKIIELMEQYQTKYGPLVLTSNSLNSYPWAWDDKPWPWENN